MNCPVTDSESLRQTPFSSYLLRRTEAEVADQTCLYFPTNDADTVQTIFNPKSQKMLP